MHILYNEGNSSSALLAPARIKLLTLRVKVHPPTRKRVLISLKLAFMSAMPSSRDMLGLHSLVNAGVTKTVGETK